MFGFDAIQLSNGHIFKLHPGLDGSSLGSQTPHIGLGNIHPLGTPQQGIIGCGYLKQIIFLGAVQIVFPFFNLVFGCLIGCDLTAV